MNNTHICKDCGTQCVAVGLTQGKGLGAVAVMLAGFLLASNPDASVTHWVFMHSSINLTLKSLESVNNAIAFSGMSLIFFGILLLFFFSTKKRFQCSSCGSRNVIPIDSPVGKELAGPTEQGRFTADE